MICLKENPTKFTLAIQNLVPDLIEKVLTKSVEDVKSSMKMRYTNEEFILEIGRIHREMSELTHISNENARLRYATAL